MRQLSSGLHKCDSVAWSYQNLLRRSDIAPVSCNANNINNANEITCLVADTGNDQGQASDASSENPPQSGEVSIPLLRNGNKLQAVVVGAESLLVTNTCGLDALLQIMATGFHDSGPYRDWVNQQADCPVWNIIRNLAGAIVDPDLYQTRAIFARDHLQPTKRLKVKTCTSNLRVINCQSALRLILDACLAQSPTAIDKRVCNGPRCPDPERVKLVSYLEVQKASLFGFNVLEAQVAGHIKGSADVKLCTVKIPGALKDDVGTYTDDEDANVRRCCGMAPYIREASQGHIFVEVTEPNPKHRLLECKMKLQEAPVSLKVEGKEYFLRGIVAMQGSRDVKSVGHYVAFCKRSTGWSKYDDLATAVSAATASTTVREHVIVYTI